MSHVTIGSRCLAHVIHVSSARCCCLDTLRPSTHLPFHSPVLRLHLPCGLVRRRVPRALQLVKSKALWPRTILSQFCEPNFIDNYHISETTDIFIQESSSDGRPSNLHDLEFDDYTIGKVLSSPLFQEREA